MDYTATPVPFQGPKLCEIKSDSADSAEYMNTAIISKSMSFTVIRGESVMQKMQQKYP